MDRAKRQSIKDYVVEGSKGDNLIFEQSILSEQFLPQYSSKNYENTVDMNYYAACLRDFERKKKKKLMKKTLDGVEQQTNWEGKREGERESSDDDDDGNGHALHPLLKSREVCLTDPMDENFTWKEYYLPLTLNLVSTFFYMTNYNIAGPTSVKYIESLGGNGALA
eukprot:11320569-Ditylum_brightwellii.AAC.1